MVWIKPATHIESDAERRIRAEVKRNWTRGEMKITNILLEGDAGSGKTQLAKALSADFGLPYTKVTCFADMDKSDVLGSILPVLPRERGTGAGVEYQYYPSEIVRAYESGWLLEIQEPTVIRDAAVLMALNSALEPDGSINLPTRIVHRHPDFIVVITANRGYNGSRLLNEALRDRIQHTEKMDLPTVKVMMERARAKTGCKDKKLLQAFAQVIVQLDKTAKANAIKGVSGMRSYFFWVDAVLHGAEPVEALYFKVIYKITTDMEEISILEQALSERGMLTELKAFVQDEAAADSEATEGREEEAVDAGPADDMDNPPETVIRQALYSADRPSRVIGTAAVTEVPYGGDMLPYHEAQPDEQVKLNELKRSFRRRLNKEARETVKGSLHEKINLIVHRPEATLAHYREYQQIASVLMPVIRELVRKTEPLLEHDMSADFSPNSVYGTRFHAEKLADPDFRYFSKKRPPEEEPSLAVALRIDQSASMNALGRLDAAKQAAVAVYEFCASCGIPLLIYGDTADRSPLEKMSLYSYIDWEEPALNDKYSLMAIQSRSNNRDGMALRILSEKMVKAPQTTKLLISISDGRPQAIPDYTGAAAVEDMKQVIGEYSRKGILFLAAAIGQDKETICDIYGQERFMDITDLRRLPARLVQIIAKYL